MMENPFEALVLKAGTQTNLALALGVDVSDVTRFRRGQIARVTAKVRQGLEGLGVEVEGFAANYEAYREEKVEGLREALRVKIAKTGGGE